jgi:hypothetical protein
LDTVTHLENLKKQQEALDKSILASISVTSPTKMPRDVSNRQQDISTLFGRRKRPTNRPEEMRIGSYRKAIRYAYEIPLTVADCIIEQGKALPTMPNFIQSTKMGFATSAEPKPLKNGQFMEVGDDQKVLLHKARVVLDPCGFQNQKLQVLFADGSEMAR